MVGLRQLQLAAGRCLSAASHLGPPGSPPAHPQSAAYWQPRGGIEHMYRHAPGTGVEHFPVVYVQETGNGPMGAGAPGLVWGLEAAGCISEWFSIRGAMPYNNKFIS